LLLLAAVRPARTPAARTLAVLPPAASDAAAPARGGPGPPAPAPADPAPADPALAGSPRGGLAPAALARRAGCRSRPRSAPAASHVYPRPRIPAWRPQTATCPSGPRPRSGTARPTGAAR